MHITSGGYDSTTAGSLRYVGSSTITSGSTLVTDGSWHHCAIVRDGSNNITLYVDGVSRGTGTDSTNYTTTAGTWYLNANDSGPTAGGAAYYSNFRIVKGTALYTSTFTPPTSPLTAIANTSLLTCQSTRMIDNSTNAFTITAAGDVGPRQFNPFGYTAQSTTNYTPTTHGGSAYFDGTGDYLNAGSNAALDLSGDFTVEMWVYGNTADWNSGDAAGYTCLVDTRNQSNATENNRLFFGIQNSISAPYFYNAGTNTQTSSSITVKVGAWNHIAYSRSGSTIKIFVNGIQGASFTDSTAFSASRWVIGTGAAVGGGSNNRAGIQGYISDHRVVKGTAIYTSNFVPPAQTLTAITNTSLLLNFTNAGIIDQHGTNVLETVGNAQLSTAVKKYGNASMYFDGTGDNLKIPSSSNFHFGTGDFTIESWLYPTAIDATASYICDQRTADSQNVLAVYILPGGTIEIYVNGGVVASGGTIALNSWSHLAITRASNSLKMFLNGTQIGSTYSLTNTLIAAPMYIGTRYNGTQYFNGYMDDLRVTKGYARYTANFTAPTNALATK
jgi:hypothetical protein